MNLNPCHCLTTINGYSKFLALASFFYQNIFEQSCQILLKLYIHDWLYDISKNINKQPNYYG